MSVIREPVMVKRSQGGDEAWDKAAFLLLFCLFFLSLAWCLMSVGGLTQRSTKPRKDGGEQGRGKEKGKKLDTTVRSRQGRINE